MAHGEDQHLRYMKRTAHELGVMGSNPGQVELWVSTSSVYVMDLNQTYKI